MRKDAALESRLADVAALQALKAIASRAELADAQSARAEAEALLEASDSALAAGALELDALLACEALDFDRWRIGRAVIEDLATACEAAANDVARCESDEAQAEVAFGHDRARENRAVKLHRALARRLAEKRDDAATLEAGALATVRKLMIRS